MGGGGGGLEEMQPIFRVVKPEWSNSNLIITNPFIFHAHTNLPKPPSLSIRLTDFQHNTFQVIKSVLDLENMREMVGIGGPWTDFVDYLKDSFTSEDLKLVLEGESKSGGAGSARVIAQKSDGMPTITIALTKLGDAPASEAMADITLELFKQYTNVHASLINEQQRCYQLSKRLEAEQDKTYVIQGQLDASLASRASTTTVSRQDKNLANQRELDASPHPRASAVTVFCKKKNGAIMREPYATPPTRAFSPSVSCQEKSAPNQRELDASPPSRAFAPAVSRQENNVAIQRELYAAPPFRAFTPSVSRQEKNDANQRKLDASPPSQGFVPSVSCQENNTANQRELDASSASKPQKFRKISDLSASSLQTLLEQSGDKRRAKITASSNTNRVIPAYRRQKVEGIILVDEED